MSYIEFFFRYFHVLAGIVWIGMLYYFNFVQTEYFKEAEASAKSDAMAKLAPRALWWFCLLYTSPSPRDATLSRMPSSA